MLLSNAESLGKMDDSAVIPQIKYFKKLFKCRVGGTSAM